MQVTTEQVIAMAPDAKSVAASKKLANVRHWKNSGYNTQALWGECQGSALYQVSVDLATFAAQCSCPSRKQPCKHSLALLLLVSDASSAITQAEPPQWVADWLAKRAETNKRKEAKVAEKAEKVKKAPSAAQLKTAEKRQALVSSGLERLDLWLNDIIRNGLGNIETQPASFWEKQAAQMVDAQAPGVAALIRNMAAVPGSSADWPEKLLAQLGQLALLTHAFRRIEQLEAPLQEEIRQLIGWSLKEDEVLTRGERITDDWLFLGQVLEENERGRAQRTWLYGKATRRAALLTQFAIAGTTFARTYPLGICQNMELIYWPGAVPQRAMLGNYNGASQALTEALPGAQTIEVFLKDVAAMLAHNPWQERFLSVLCNVVPFHDQHNDRWGVRDQEGHILHLRRGTYWNLLALSGGQPVDMAAEWDGRNLRPLGILVDSQYHLLITDTP